MLSFFPRDVLDEIFNLIESVSEGFPAYSSMHRTKVFKHPSDLAEPFRANLFAFRQKRVSLKFIRMMMVSAKLSLRAISAINRTVFELPIPRYSFADRSFAVLLLWFLITTCCYVCVYVRCCTIFKFFILTLLYVYFSNGN